MWIDTLNVKNCRSLKSIALQLSPYLNIIVGENASGKTSLLESIYLLSSGRSFRTSHISDVISHNEKEILVTANISFDELNHSHIGIEKSSSKTRIRIDKQDINSQAKLSLHLPITVIHPDSICLITGGPSYRRSYIDWIAFYLFPEFYPKWKSYQRILKQRNLSLKDSKHHYSIDKWTEELVSLQPDITQYRELALRELKPLLIESSSKLLRGKSIDIEFHSGLPKEIELTHDSMMKFYRSKLKYDLAIKRTSIGVHKANLKFFIDDKLAERSASRGQLKLLSISLLLSQSAAIKKDIKGGNDNRGIILLDDFTSELDSINEGSLIDYLYKLKQQILLTTTHENISNDDFAGKMFHVKHGLISEVS